MLFLKHKAAFIARCGDLQLGLHFSGMEKVVHQVESLLDVHPDSFVLNADWYNAFNETSRDAMENQLKEHIPNALPYFRLKYGEASRVHFGDFPMICEEGVRQGCPWATALFCLALQPVLEAMHNRYSDSVVVRAAFDDLNLVVLNRTAVRLDQLMSDLSDQGAKVGLQLRLGKCSAYSKHYDIGTVIAADELDAIRNLPRCDPETTGLLCIPHSEGFVALGTPIGADDWVRAECVRTVQKFAREMADLALIEDAPQEYYLLLRHCFNTQPQYLARTVKPRLLLGAAQKFDHAVNGRIAAPIHGLTRGPEVRRFADFSTQLKWARLPYEFGGLQIPSLQAISPPAYLSGLAAAWGTLTTEPAKGFFQADIRKGLESLAAKLPEVSILDDPEYARVVPAANAATRLATFEHLFGDSLPDDQANFFQFVSGQTDLAWSALVQRSQTKRDFQRRMNHLVSSHAYDSMLKALFPAGAPLGSRRSRRVAKFLSASCREAVEFARAVPTLPELRLRPQEYLLALAYHLHAPIPGRPILGDTCLQPTHSLGRLGHHLWECFQHRTVPHDRLCDNLHAFCRSAGLPSRREPINTLTNQAPDSQRRPDLAVENVSPGGRVLLVDATTADPAAVTNMNQHKSHRTPGAAAEAAASRKRTDYEGSFHRGTYAFTPLSVELTGRWGRDFTRFFRLVSAKARDHHGYTATRHGYFVRYWRSRLSVGLTKAFARQAAWMKQQLLDRASPQRSGDSIELARAF